MYKEMGFCSVTDLKKVRFDTGMSPQWPDFCVCEKASLHCQNHVRKPCWASLFLLRNGAQSLTCTVFKLLRCICICCSSWVDVCCNWCLFIQRFWMTAANWMQDRIPSVLHLSSVLDNSSQTAVKYHPGIHCRPGAVLMLLLCILAKDRRAWYKASDGAFLCQGMLSKGVEGPGILSDKWSVSEMGKLSKIEPFSEYFSKSCFSLISLFSRW